MRQGRPRLREIVLTDQSRRALETLSRSRTLPHGVVRRADIVPRSATGESNTAIGKWLGLSVQRVGHWRNRFLDFGIAGLYDQPRSGRPRTDDEERVARLLDTTLRSQPKNATHWSVRSAAKATGIPKTQVHRYFTLFGLQPHRSKSCKRSTDPLFVDKVRDIVGLYLNAPDKALVLCVDEKSRIQALERSQPLLPMGLGEVEGVTHDYYRHGTTTLFVALNAASGTALAQCQPRHRHQEFLAIRRHIDRNAPRELDVHLVIDSYTTHTHPRLRSWLIAGRATMCTTRPPTRPGSIGWNPGSASSPSARSVAAHSQSSPR